MSDRAGRERQGAGGSARDGSGAEEPRAPDPGRLDPGALEPRALDPGALGLGGLVRIGSAPAPVTGLAVDSREVAPGDLFFALPGAKLDGAAFAASAIRRGAAGVVATPTGAARLAADLAADLGVAEAALPVPVYLTEAPRRVLAAAAAARWPGQPATIGAVTGTNGKTSVASFLGQIWSQTGHRAASFGTTGITAAPGVAGLEAGVALTTPEPLALHRLLDRLAAAGVTHAAMEASSHGLAQHRLDGVRLSVGALTHIGRDHLDYHASQADYVAAKLRLFADLLPHGAAAVVNAADAVAPRVAEIARARGLALTTVGPEGADLVLSDRAFAPEGQRVTLRWAGRAHPVSLPLLGAFQAENAAVAAAMALATGAEPEAVISALGALVGVRGRMERVARRRTGALVVVDYAHTPDALATALSALRPHCAGRLVVVAGAGGDRDRGKRPLMGRAMAEGAELAIVTDDNPRSEDPAAIRAEVMAGASGASGASEVIEIGERRAAIIEGVRALVSSGDCLLIAGKGHETGQEIAGRIHPFDDAAEARAAVDALDGPGAGGER